ncbi:hypothetical protein ACOQFV_24520 [Nocardiopsis changdeensis]|uniref:Uncharacterized protein n=1 Tax=Nocardiopsis changdeensis TaxID=2831969 RepID=A0A975KQG6_9ACTN|nr:MULTISPECIES: hypothetical protein [Nocardiopsis]QUX26444.1 hypothetical protein KGD84_32620 [Nocardiopsis changdeensis]QYX40716.1 hypothetical protein K1J57_32470 [Nocardiopsis sp. MT53]
MRTAGSAVVYRSADGVLIAQTRAETADPVEAADQARARALRALEEAGATGAHVEALEVATDAETRRRIMHPDPLPVVGAAEAGKILGDMSAGRVSQLLGEDSPRRDPGAPTPVVKTGRGDYYLRAAVELYGMERDRTQRPHKYDR